MNFPSLQQLNGSTNNGQISITRNMVDHPAFALLLNAINADSLQFSNATILSEGEKAIVVKGNSLFFDSLLQNAYLYIYPNAGNADVYNFEWFGVLPATSFAALYRLGVLISPNVSRVQELLSGTFTKVNLLYTSVDKAFSLEVLNSEANLSITGTGIRLQQIGFFYERSLDRAIEASFNISSTLNIGGTTIKTELELPAGNPLDPVNWSLKLIDQVVLNDGLNDVASFIAGKTDTLSNTILDSLPAVVRNIPKLALSRLIIIIDPVTPGLELIDFSVQSLREFELVQGFILQNVGAGAFINRVNSKYNCALSMFGTFVFNDFAEATVRIMLPLNKIDDWTIEMEGSLDLDNIADLEKLPFIKLADLNLPKEWLKVKDIHMDDLEIVFNPTEAKVKSVYFSLQLNAESGLIPGIKVKDPYLTFNLTF